MFTIWFRKVTQWIVVPTAGFFARLGVSANALTIVGCLLNVAVALVIATGQLRLGGFCLIAAAGFDAFDGAVARQTGNTTKFGAFLDSVLDRVSESAVLLGLAWWYMTQGGQTEAILAYTAIVGSLLVSYARARAEGIGVECKVGLFTRVERAIILIAGLVLGLSWLALWLLAIGTVLTTVHRIVAVYLQTRNQPLS
jgi:CDP-diacylglycerol---glycerol-3-phosphate 3-phosphatidyltransferase